MTSNIDPTKPLDGVPAVKGDLRQNLQHAKDEIEALQSSAPVNVKDYGAVGDGTFHPLSENFNTLAEAQAFYGSFVTSLTDDGLDWAAIQKLVIDEANIFLPDGDYPLDKPVVLAPNTAFLTMRGAGWSRSRIYTHTSFPAEFPMFHQSSGFSALDNTARDANNNIVANPSGTWSEALTVVTVNNLELVNTSSLSPGCMMIIATGPKSKWENCQFNTRSRGLILGQTHAATIAECQFIGQFNTTFGGDYANAAEYVALHVPGSTNVIGCDFTRVGTGLRFQGPGGGSMLGCRFEICGYGFVAGGTSYDIATYGSNRPLRAFFAGGNTFEKNMVAMRLDRCQNSSFQGFNIDGSPPGAGLDIGSQIGLEIDTSCHHLNLENGAIRGEFLDSCVRLRERCEITIRNVDISNNEAGRPNIAGAGHIYGQNASIPVSFSNRIERDGVLSDAHSDLVTVGLNAFKYDQPVVHAKKLGGAETPVNAATSVDIVWSDPIAGSSVGFTGQVVTVVTDASSTLAANDYEYVTTVLTGQGETDIHDNADDTATVAAGERVDMSFNGSTVDASIRRVYRRVVGQDKWDGYFEVAIGASFSDTGQAFDGSDAPPTAGMRPYTLVEDDNNYSVVANASWDTSVFVTNKTANGFTLNFGTAAPTANEVVDWLIFRP